MTAKQVRAQYIQEFKLEAVRQVRAGQAIAVVAKVLGIPKASLGNWVRQAAKGPLSGAGEADKAVRVSPEQMDGEIARLRAEVARRSAGGTYRPGHRDRRQPSLQLNANVWGLNRRRRCWWRFHGPGPLRTTRPCCPGDW